MPVPLSFVIPVLNEDAIIGALLADLRARYPASELIVVDGGSTDQTVVRAMPLCDHLLVGEAGRAAQMNLGGRVARGEYICFLHADSRPGIAAVELDAALAEHPGWGFCRIRLTGTARSLRVIEWFMNHRSRLTAVATGDQMLFLQQSLFMQSGGFDPLPLMEDVAYCKRLRQRSRPHILAQAVESSSRRWEEGGVVRTVLQMWWLRLAYVLGVSPQTLSRNYYGH